MLDYQKIMNYRNGNNPFARHSGITITDMKNGYAKGEMEITEFHKNPIDSVHGGCLYTLADATGGAAAASHGKMLTTLNSSFEFLKPAIHSSISLAASSFWESPSFAASARSAEARLYSILLCSKPIVSSMALESL